VNQALRQVQAASGTLVREQRREFYQPEAEWPVRAGEYGRATLIIGHSDQRLAADRVADVTRLLQKKGAWVNEVRSQGDGTVQLAVGYDTQLPDFAALSRMLDNWNATPSLAVQETAYARLVRGEVRQPAPAALPAPGKAITRSAQAEEQKSAGEYEL
jgi:hypothetical protein